MGVQLRSVHRHYANPEVVVRFRAQVHLIEDGSDVVLEETIESPRHLQRTAENGESSSKLAVVVRIAQVKLHVSTCEDSLLRRNDNRISKRWLSQNILQNIITELVRDGYLKKKQKTKPQKQFAEHNNRIGKRWFPQNILQNKASSYALAHTTRALPAQVVFIVEPMPFFKQGCLELGFELRESGEVL